MKRWVTAVLCSCALAVQGCAGSARDARTPSDELGALDGRASYEAGITYASRGDFTRAEQYLVSALHAGHERAAVVRALVGVCVRASRLRSALSYAASHLAEHPGDVPLRKLVAALHMALGERDLAERALTLVIASAPADADAHYLLALAVREPQRARTHFARYLELAPHGSHAEEARAVLHQAS